MKENGVKKTLTEISGTLSEILNGLTILGVLAVVLVVVFF